MSDEKGKNMLYFSGMIAIAIAIMFSVVMPKVVYDAALPKDGKGHLEITKQDQYTPIVDLKLTRFLDNITLLDNYSVGDYLVNVSTTGHVITVENNSVCFKENGAFYQADILAVTSLGGNDYQIELEAPLDYPYTVNGGCSIRDNNWAKDGSVNNLIYAVSPFGLNNQSWDITRVILVCRGDGVGASNDKPDTSSFFTQLPLAKGIVFRSVDGNVKNIFTARDNFHLQAEAYDVTFYDSNRQGEYAVTVRRTFNGDDKNGVTIRLVGDDNDRFELIVRDDLTDMTECHAIAQGHVVD